MAGSERFASGLVRNIRGYAGNLEAKNFHQVQHSRIGAQHFPLHTFEAPIMSYLDEHFHQPVANAELLPFIGHHQCKFATGAIGIRHVADHSQFPIWAQALLERRVYNKACVAVANKPA